MGRRKDPSAVYRYSYSVAFTDEQRAVLDDLTITYTKTYSQLVEEAFGAYIEPAFGMAWPPAVRLYQPPLHRKRRTAIYGSMFTEAQDIVIRRILREYGLRYSQLIERAFADYLPATYDVEWPSAKRLGRLVS